MVVKPSDDPHWPSTTDATLARQFALLHPDAPFVVTPIRCEGEIIGALAGHVTDAARVFDRRDVARLETFATMVGLALANVRFYATLNAKVEERTRSLREAQAALVQSEKMDQVTLLDLGGNKVGDAGAIAIANSPHLGNLKRLDLFRNQITSKGIEALIRSKHLPNLEYLDLTANAASPEEIQFLEKMADLPSIKILIIQ